MGNIVKSINVDGKVQYPITLAEAVVVTEQTGVDKETGKPIYSYDSLGHKFSLFGDLIYHDKSEFFDSNKAAKKVSGRLKIGAKSFNGNTDVTITAADLGLQQALNFVGLSETDPTIADENGNGGAKVLEKVGQLPTQNIYKKGNTFKIGDVVLYNSKEFVLTGTETTTDLNVGYNIAVNWTELGDESAYALKDNVYTKKEIDYLLSNTTFSPTQIHNFYLDVLETANVAINEKNFGSVDLVSTNEQGHLIHIGTVFGIKNGSFYTSGPGVDIKIGTAQIDDFERVVGDIANNKIKNYGSGGIEIADFDTEGNLLRISTISNFKNESFIISKIDVKIKPSQINGIIGTSQIDSYNLIRTFNDNDNRDIFNRALINSLTVGTTREDILSTTALRFSTNILEHEINLTDTEDNLILGAVVGQ